MEQTSNNQLTTGDSIDKLMKDKDQLSEKDRFRRVSKLGGIQKFSGDSGKAMKHIQKLRFLFNKPLESDFMQDGFNERDTKNARMLVYPEKMKIKSMVKGVYGGDILSREMVKERLTSGKGILVEAKPGLESFLKESLKNNAFRRKVVARKKLNAVDIEAKLVQKSSLETRLRKLTQSQFLELFYSPYVLEDYGYDPQIPDVKEKENAKKLFVMIAKRKAENERMLKTLKDDFLSTGERKNIKNTVRNNTRVIWHLKNQISKLLEICKLSAEDLETYIFEDSLRNVNFNIDDFKKFKDLVRETARKSMTLIGFDKLEARAIYNRTSASSISDLIKTMKEYKEKGLVQRFKSILQASLLTKKRTREIYSNLEAIEEFEENFHFESDKIAKKNEKIAMDLEENVMESKNEDLIKEADAQSLDHAYTFLPFWDTKISHGSKDDAIFLRKQLKVTLPDSFNFSQVTNCQTIRELILYYRNNRQVHNVGLFTSQEIKVLSERGVALRSIENFSRMIVFLSNQSLVFAKNVYNFLSKENVIIKCDLRGAGNITYSGLSAVFATILTINHPIRRLDISYLGVNNDLGSLLYFLLSNKKLEFEELQISGNVIGEDGYNNLHRALKQCSGLKTLSLARCNIKSDSFRRIPTLFREDKPRIISLNLRGNPVGDSVISDLLKNMAYSQTLKYLNISDSLCSNKILRAVGNFLLLNKVIECFEFEENFFTDDSIDEFQDSIIKSGKTSQLKVIKIGTFRESITTISDVFKISLSYLPKLVLAKISKIATMTNDRRTFTGSLAMNRALYIVENVKDSISRQKKKMQTPQMIFFNELYLMQGEETVEGDLRKIYSRFIKKCDGKNLLKIPYTLRRLWNKFEIQQTNTNIEIENKSSITARYLLNYAFENYDSSEQLEFIIMVDKLLHSSETPFMDGHKIIHKVIRFSNKQVLMELLKLGYDIEENTKSTVNVIPKINGYHLLFLLGDFSLLKQMLNFKPKINRKDEFGNTLLHYASIFGNIELQKILISLDFDLLETNNEGLDLLHSCVLSDSLESFEYILEQRGIRKDYPSFILKKTNQGRTCLHLAVKYNSRKIFYFILKHVDILDDPDSRFKTALMYAIEQNNGEFIQTLISRGANIFAADDEGNNILFYAVRYKNLNLFDNMLYKFGDKALKRKNDLNEDLLYAAATANSARLVRKFLQMGMNPKAKTRKNITAFDIIQKSQILVNVYREFFPDEI